MIKRALTHHPYSQQVSTMTCTDAAGEVRHIVRTTTDLQTDDIPALMDEMYETLARQGFDQWVHDSTIARLVQPVIIPPTHRVDAPRLADLLAAVTLSTGPLPFTTDDVMVNADALEALVSYVRLLTGQVTAPHMVNPHAPLDDDEITAILHTGTDKDVTVALNTLLAAPPLPPAIPTPQEIMDAFDEVDWATPDDVRDLLAGQPDLPTYEGDDL